MKISHAVLALTLIFMGASSQANTKPATPLQSRAATAVKCFNIDDDKCNKSLFSY